EGPVGRVAGERKENEGQEAQAEQQRPVPPELRLPPFCKSVRNAEELAAVRSRTHCAPLRRLVGMAIVGIGVKCIDAIRSLKQSLGRSLECRCLLVELMSQFYQCAKV